MNANTRWAKSLEWARKEVAKERGKADAENELLDLLHDIVAELDRYVDLDPDAEQPYRPNRAMRLRDRLLVEIENLEEETNAEHS